MKNFVLAIVIAASPLAMADKKNPSMIGGATSSASPYTYGSNYKYEADLNLSQGQIHSYKLGDNSYTDIDVRGAFHYHLQDQIQIGTEAGLIAYREGTSSKGILELMGVFTYNFEREFKNSFFGQVGLGLAPAYDKTTGKFESKFSFFFDIGKRFYIWDHVSYKPEFRISKFGDQDIEFNILALNFSLSF